MCTNIPLIPNRNNYVCFACNVCRPTKILADATSSNQASVETNMSKELNNTSRGVRLDFHEQGPFRALEFYQCVTKCCSDYNHAPKFCLSFILEPPYQPSLAACLALSSTLDSFFSMDYHPVNVSLLHSLHRLPFRTWAIYLLRNSLRKFS